MSFMLPDVDLSTAMVGSKGRILLQTMGVGAGGVSANPSLINNPPTLYIHNDSGCGLGMTLKDSGKSFNLPAGAWVPVPIGPGESELDYIVKYVLPNAPVNLLMIAYYAPGEPVPQTATLGNSPVGIGGSTNNVTNTSLSNEGNAANTLVIDIGDTTLAQLWKVWTDHFSVSVDQSNVAHTVLQGNTTGNPLQIGQAGDITEVLGQLTVDQVLTALSATINTISSQAATNLKLNAGAGAVVELDIGGVLQGTFTGGNFHWENHGILCSNIQFDTVGGITAINTGTVSVGATSTVVVNHGLGGTPAAVLVTTDQALSSGTNSAHSYTSTQFSLFNGAGATLVYRWVAYR